MPKQSTSLKKQRTLKRIFAGIVAVVVILGVGAVMLMISARRDSTDFRSQASGGNKKNDPQGYFDNADNQNCSLGGWVADPNDTKAPSKIHVYLDRPYDRDPKKTGLLLGEFTTDVLREDVNTALSTSGNHGFRVSLQANAAMPKDGKEHQMYIYGINNVGTPGNHALLTNSPKTLRCSPPNVQGTFDTADNQSCSVAGWVTDADDLKASAKIHVYLDRPYDADKAKSGVLLGEFTTDVLREDVNKAMNATGKHGFRVSLQGVGGMPKDGKDHQMYVYGINLPGTTGTNVLLANSPRTLRCSPPAPPNVQGNLDGANSTNCKIGGWAADIDKLGESVMVHVYKDKPYGQSGTLIAAVPADKPRPDVNQKTPFTGKHGFDLSLSNELRGKGATQIYVYAINIAGTPGSNVLLAGSPKAIECK